MLQIIKFTTKRCKDITYFGIRNHPWFTFRFLYMLYFMKDIFAKNLAYQNFYQ